MFIEISVICVKFCITNFQSDTHCHEALRYTCRFTIPRNYTDGFFQESRIVNTLIKLFRIGNYYIHI